jgi:predicted  nucleic acid-binding Zn-ribbon protein
MSELILQAMEKIQRDRDQLSRENLELSRLLGMSGEREADLRGKIARLERELVEAREQLDDAIVEAAHYMRQAMKVERELAEAREQRDMLAEALEYVVDDLDVETRGRIGHSGKWCSLITAREALAAVKGGSHDHHRD